MSDPRYALFEELIEKTRNNSHNEGAQTLSVDTDIYSSQQQLDDELSLVFSDTPIIVGHAAMLSEAGSHFTHDHLGKPLLIVRGKDDKIRALLNVCRHRGVRLSNAEDISKRSTFVCPYPHWVYDLDGSLKTVPLEESLPGLDKSCRGLLEVPCEVRHGFIWVNPNPEGTLDLDTFLGDLALDFEAYRVSEQSYFAQSTKIKKTNWKLIVDAFLDGYHVARLHRKTVGPLFKDSVAASARSGLHVRSLVARKEFDEALDLPKEQWCFSRHGTMAYQVFPNTTLIFHPDYLSILTLYPTKPDETVVVHTCLIPEAPKNEKEQGHWERAFSIIENGVFEAEDFFVCEQAQVGLSAGVKQDFLLGGYEESIKMFHAALQENIAERKSET
jgi:phenylpropionate dioxygenase-like ring-hydroxylating dioxygenase large terminal subunit